MEQCDEKNKIYTRQWSIAKYTRAAANIFITRKEKMRDGKPYCQSQPCICTASHPGVTTTKIHRCYSIKLFQNWADFHVVLKHLGAYAPSWPVWHCLGAELHADRSRRHSLIATWAFVRTSWGSQVLIQSPSHSTRNSMLPCSSVRLCLMVFTPHSFSSAFDCIRCFCKHIAVSVNTRYHGRISTFIIIRKHSQNSNYFNGKVNGNHVLLFKCACETNRLPLFT